MALFGFAHKPVGFFTWLGRWKDPSKHCMADSPPPSGDPISPPPGCEPSSAGSNGRADTTDFDLTRVADDGLAPLHAGIRKPLRREDLYARPGLVFGGPLLRTERHVEECGERDKLAEDDAGVGAWEDPDEGEDLDRYRSSRSLFGSMDVVDINPATGLLMLDDTVDLAGNPYGFDWH